MPWIFARSTSTDVQQSWHRRLQHDPANKWLRGLFHEVNRREGNAVLPA